MFNLDLKNQSKEVLGQLIRLNKTGLQESKQTNNIYK